MAETRRILRLEQSEPVHAVCDTPKISFQRMVGIDFGRAQSTHMGEIHLATDINFGIVNVLIGDYNYTLSLASALVILEKHNANIVPHSKYATTLSDGEIDSSTTESQESARKSGIGIEVKAGLTSGGKAEFGFGLNRGSGQSADATIKVKHQINLVSPEGQDSWRIGGSGGNPLLPTKDLRGPVINSRRDDVARPLCTLEAIDPDKSVTGRLRIQANPYHFRLHGEGREARVKDQIIDELQGQQGRFACDERENEQELRERVATMALLKPMCLPKRTDADEGMLDIASRSFTFVPETDDPDPQ